MVMVMMMVMVVIMMIMINRYKKLTKTAAKKAAEEEKNGDISTTKQYTFHHSPFTIHSPFILSFTPTLSKLQQPNPWYFSTTVSN